jgi:hypothetical protein
MRASIEERMERQISKTRKYNGMFDVAVSAVETSLATTAVEAMDNQYTATADNLTVFITCNDSDNSTIYVSVDYQSTTGNMRIADLTINVDAVYEEHYHSIPRAIRTTVFEVINTVIDDITAFIEGDVPAEE